MSNDKKYPLCLLLQPALFSIECVALSPEQKAEAFCSAQEHKVVPLAYAGALDTVELKNEYLVSVCFYYRLLNAQSVLTETLFAHGITPVILKGVAAGIYYPHPEERTYGDIDFFVYPDCFDRAVSTLSENGFSVLQDVHEYTRHIKLKHSGVILEMHRFWCYEDSWAAPENARDFNRMVFEAVPQEATICGKRFFMLPKLENGLVLLDHINQHINSGLGLRQILDWMMYAKTNLTEEYWEHTFEPAAQKYGLKILAVTVSRMCNIYLGLPMQSWFFGADTAVCEELMEYIMDSGNFGVKLSKGEPRNVENALTANHTLLGWLKRFQLSGIIHWKAAEKHRILRPLAGFYGFGRYLALGIRRKGAILKLIKEFSAARKHRKLLMKIRGR